MPDVSGQYPVRPASPTGSTVAEAPSLLLLNRNHASDLLAVAIEDTMIIGMKGIAAGMQNTG